MNLDVIDDMLNRLSGRRTMTVEEALLKLVEYCERNCSVGSTGMMLANQGRAALSAAEKDGWQTIETADRKDMDTVIQLWCPYEGIFNGAAREIGFAKRPGWRVMAYPYQGADDSAGNALTNETATHWRPLPAPPSEG